MASHLSYWDNDNNITATPRKTGSVLSFEHCEVCMHKLICSQLWYYLDFVVTLNM